MIRGTMFAALAAGMLFAGAMPSHAEDIRLVTHEFSEDEVVQIEGRLGVQATIRFADDEHIENVAVGDSGKWQITPNKRANLLFVKPLDASARTNMTVVTDRHTYFFDLVASPRSKPLYLLRFAYSNVPEETEKTAQPDSPPLNEVERAAMSGDPLSVPSDPAVLNFAWDRKGDSGLFPSRVYDDGSATYLVWNEKQDIPAILVRNEKGVEGPVNYAVRGNTIVIDNVPAQIVLRTGKATATLVKIQGGRKTASRFAPPHNNWDPFPARGSVKFAALSADHRAAAYRRN